MSEYDLIMSHSKSLHSNEEYGTFANKMELPAASSSISKSNCGDTESTCEVSERKEVALMSNTATLMHLLKGNVGVAALASPSAFANSGLLLGSLVLPVICALAIHCMNILVNCHDKLCKKYNCISLDFDEVAEKAFLSGPNCMKIKAKCAKAIINVFLLTSQIGICCVYCIFIADNTQQFIKGITNGKIIVSIKTIMIVTYPIMVLFNMMRRLKHFEIASTAANIVQVTATSIIFYVLFTDLPPTWTRPATAHISRVPLFLGTAIFAFEGIGIILPLHKEMKDPSAFAGCSGVLNTGMVIVGSIYFAIGFFGFLKYGDEVKGSITLNLPSTPLCETVQLLMTVAMIPMYALQLYVAISIIEPFMRNKLSLEESSCMSTVVSLSLRASLVTLTYILACLVPNLELAISLIGALCSSSLALIFPPVIETATLWEENISKNSWILIAMKNIIIVAFGFISFLTGTYVSVLQIMDTF